MLENPLITCFSHHVFEKEIFSSVIPEEFAILLEVIVDIFESPL
ncbi:hypothetical protein FM106_11105 [Brachybacterium faecium]|nr:hypothetical protein FM106_11105 [Brachybacterium faecium]